MFLCFGSNLITVMTFLKPLQVLFIKHWINTINDRVFKWFKYKSWKCDCHWRGRNNENKKSRSKSSSSDESRRTQKEGSYLFLLSIFHSYLFILKVLRWRFSQKKWLESKSTSAPWYFVSIGWKDFTKISGCD